MKALTQFYPFVEPEVMGCPYAVIDHHLILAIRDFCQRAKAWKEWVDAFTADGTSNTFDFDLTGGQDIVKVARALRNDRPLSVKSEDQMPADWQTGTSDDVADTIVQFDGSSFMVFPLPDAGDVFRLQMVFQPSIGATQVGDVLYDAYADQVSAGAKARLMAMLGQSWSNPALAKKFSDDFEANIRRAANSDFAQRDKFERRSKPMPGPNWRITPWPLPPN